MEKKILYNGNKSIYAQMHKDFVLYDSNFKLNKKYRESINSTSKEEILDKKMAKNQEIAKDIILRNNDVIFNGKTYMWIYLNQYTHYFGPDVTIRGHILNKDEIYSIKNEKTKPYENNDDDKGWHWGRGLVGEVFGQMLYQIDGHWIPELYENISGYKVVHNMTQGDFIIPKEKSLLDKIIQLFKN
jgi:hypothetical protein